MKPILDACCGARMFYFNKNNPNVFFMDNREVSTFLCDGRKFEIKPDIIGDFKNINFPDESFYLVIFDPRLYVINREIDFGIKESHPNNACFEATNDLYGSRQLVDFELKRVGILGVTHEFVNDREA